MSYRSTEGRAALRGAVVGIAVALLGGGCAVLGPLGGSEGTTVESRRLAEEHARLGARVTGPDRGEALAAAATLEALGPGAAPAAEALGEALHDGDPAIRLAAARAISAAGVGARPALGDLEDAVRDSVPQVAIEAWVGIARTANRAEAAAEGLAAYLAHPDPSVRRAAAKALGSLGSGARKARAALVARIDDPEIAVGLEARVALTRIAGGGTAYFLEFLRALDLVGPELRSLAFDGIAAVGPRGEGAAPRLAALLLDSADARDRRGAASALAAIGPRGLARLRQALRSESPGVREDAARALGEAGREGGPAVEDLLTCAGDPDPRVADGAVRALGAIAPADPRVVEALVARAREAPRLRGAVGDSLAQAGRTGAETLAPLLEGDDGEEAVWAAEVLVRIGAPALGSVAAARDRGSARARILRARIRGMLSRDARREARGIAGFLGDPSPSVRLEAMDALAALGRDAAPAVPTLVALVERGTPDECEAAVRTLGALGPAAAVAVPLLTARLRLPSRRDRLEAAWALGSIGPSAASSTNELAARLRDREGAVRSEAAVALGRIGPGACAAVGSLLALVENDASARAEGLEALGRIGGGGEALAGRLLDLAASSDGRTAVGAAHALVAIGEREARREWIAPLAEHPNRRVRAWAHRALGASEPRARRGFQFRGRYAIQQGRGGYRTRTGEWWNRHTRRT